MTDLAGAVPLGGVRTIRGEKFIRGLNRVLPLGRKYHPLLGALNGRHGLLELPFGPYRLLRPAAWTKSVTTQLMGGVKLFPEFELLRPLCADLSDGVLIDAGANTGVYTLLFRSVSALPIIAYEPQPLLYQLLVWNIAHNQLPKVTARNVACGSQSSEVAFWMGLNGSVVPADSEAASRPRHDVSAALPNWEQEALLAQAGQTVVTVPVVTLDQDLAEIARIAVLKIDCEGFEYHILKGAQELIRRHRPILFLEVHPHELTKFGHSTEAVLDLLAPDYELEFWYFRLERHASKLARSLARFRRLSGHRCADAAEMLSAAKRSPGPGQIYFLGRPRVVARAFQSAVSPTF